jgi:uncharacterized SAM-binding protein YcdF (DUF218 family)
MARALRRDGRSRAALIGSLSLLLMAAGAMLLIPQWLRGEHGEPLSSGPVIALGGGLGRVEAATDIARRRDDAPELLLSVGRTSTGSRQTESCRAPNVRCVFPDPVSTYGEALMVARLARDEGWPAATIVTDDLHAPRARLLFSRCVGVPTSVVAVRRQVDGTTRLRQALREVTATGVTFVRHRCEPR